MKQVMECGALGMTYEEMADHFNCSIGTICDRMKGQSKFLKMYKKGLNTMKRSLRRKQVELAMAGDRTMQIWLGKQYLDQKDQRKEEHVGKDGGPIDIKVGWPDSEGKQGKKAKGK
jgi:predicted DNA-binding protein YlxM (UPF0122 family)